jgi:hypothetical protein
MIDVVFTLDYELDDLVDIEGGRLEELVYIPAEKLRNIFERRGVRFVNFVEVVELAKIEAFRTDPAINAVRRQIRDLYEKGFETGLHLHPHWSNAHYSGGTWRLNWNEHNLCTLPQERITQIIDGSLTYLRRILDQPEFTPLSFRAGYGLFQPCRTAAKVLGGKGIKVDSSVFKGGLKRNLGLDYRPSLRNGHYWTFSSDVNKEDRAGTCVELPIHTTMVPFWKKMSTSKGMSSLRTSFYGSATQKVNRLRDLLRLTYPLQLDFCQLTLDELIAMTNDVIRQDRVNPKLYRPIVAIGHTYELTDPNTVDQFLLFLKTERIEVVTFKTVYSKLVRGHEWSTSLSYAT